MEHRNKLLGIDPSFTNFGVAIHDPKTKQLDMFTGDFMSAVSWIGGQIKLKNAVAVVENPALDSTTFGMWGIVKKQFEAFIKYRVWQATRIGKPPTEKTIEDVRSAFSIAMNYAQKVGQNKAAAKLIIKMLHDKGVPVIEVAPSKRDKAYKGQDKTARKPVLRLKMPTKTNRQQFKELTGFDGVSSEHARDAATLIVGRTMNWAFMEIEIEAAKNKNRPSSYPSTVNESEFLVKRKH